VTVDDRHHGLIFVLGSVILGEVEARALKQSMSLQISRLLEKESLSKAEMAARMKTIRVAVDRLLDASNPSVNRIGHNQFIFTQRCRNSHFGNDALE
jgi:hypothetical protein